MKKLAFFVALAIFGLGPSPAAWAQNTAYGTNALISNTTGTDNSAFGANALQQNNSGSGNTATGWDALLFNTSGYNNTATGIATEKSAGSNMRACM